MQRQRPGSTVGETAKKSNQITLRHWAIAGSSGTATAITNAACDVRKTGSGKA